MYSLAIALTLSQPLGPSSLADEPIWLTVYGQAWRRGHGEHKPLAIFIGSGATGWEQFAEEGQLGNDVLKTLSARYVCVYLDTETHESRLVVQRLDVAASPALVISSPGGAFQAFRHEGVLRQDDLVFFLKRFADPKRQMRSTESIRQLNESSEDDAEPIHDAHARALGPTWSSTAAGRTC